MGKIVGIDDLLNLADEHRAKGSKIVHCHGCFDLMHPGHILYLQEAKTMGDILIVTVTPDKYVDKGPGRPVFREELRVLSIAALECVDFAAINKWRTAEELLRLLRPHIYVKGQEFAGGLDKTGKIQKEMSVIEEIGGEIRFTNQEVFSSTRLLSEHFHGKESQ
jgi:rfaE bifunctional protein nucleotidyltransferase chain/domain